MTWFTDSPFERMMTQKPDTGDIGTTRRPSPHSPACTGYPYNKGLSPCIGYCIKKLQAKENTYN